MPDEAVDLKNVAEDVNPNIRRHELWFWRTVVEETSSNCRALT